MALTAEQILKQFDWSQQFHLGSVFASGKKPCAASARIGDEYVTVEAEIRIPVAQVDAAILPLMATLHYLGQVARGEAPALPFELAVSYVAKVWFPVAAMDYVVDQSDEFIGEGQFPHMDEYGLFQKVMERVFWHTISLDMPDPEGFEAAVYEAIDEQVFEDCRRRLNEIASEPPERTTTGDCQADYL